MNKKIVKITRDYYHFIKDMTDKQAGEFIKSICERVYEGKPLVTKDSYLKAVYVYVERDLKISAINSLNGKRRAAALVKKKGGILPTDVEVVILADNKGVIAVE